MNKSRKNSSVWCRRKFRSLWISSCICMPGSSHCHHPEADNSSVHICDEILDIGTTEVEHFLQAFDAVLENTDLWARKKMCTFIPAINYLGHISDANSLNLSPVKQIKATKEASAQSNVPELKVGPFMCSCWFLPNLIFHYTGTLYVYMHCFERTLSGPWIRNRL